jgi:hypothetical protein
MFLKNKIVMHFEIWCSTFVCGEDFVLAILTSVIKRHEGKKKEKSTVKEKIKIEKRKKREK